MTIPLTVKDATPTLLHHRQRFGLMMRNWRLRNGWTQYTFCDWALATNNPDAAPSYGNLSVLEQGKAGELRQKAFWQLWEMNRRIAHRDWGDPLQIKDQLLRERLFKAIPVGDNDTPLWMPQHFWAAYNGLHPIPAYLLSTPAPSMNAKVAAAINNDLRARFRKRGAEHPDPVALLEQLRSRVLPAHAGQFAAVLLGMADYSAADLMTLWDPDTQTYLPQQWVTA
jgi:hypothetical protein